MQEKKDTYKTIATPSEGIYKEKGSKFITYAFPVYSEDQIKEHLQELKKKYYDARHHCYAWRLGADHKQFRANDDGEPSGSAGQPILGQIRSYELTNIFIVVIRYFGGIKLGVGGLIHAYKTAAADAIENAEIVELTVDDFITISFDYIVMNDVMKIIKDMQLEQSGQKFEMMCELTLKVRQKDTEQVLEKLEKIESLKVENLTIGS